jgi:AcrR family transcriptional regulator
MIHLYIMSPGAKPASQKRSQKTRDALVEALDGLLRAKDFATISVAEIAAAAGVSAASIYQRFDNKDATVSILLELYMRRVAEWTRSPEGRVVNVLAASSLRSALVALGEAVWLQADALGHVMRPAYLYSRLRPELLGAQWTERLAQARTGFRALLEKHKSEIRRSDLGRAAGMVAGFYNMMLVGLLLHRDDVANGSSGHDALESPEAFASELADFACGYLSMPDDALTKEQTTGETS